MAELQNQPLTAGHDLVAIDPPVHLDVVDGSRVYTHCSGQEQRLKEGGMDIADRQVVISSNLYGHDWRSRIAEITGEIVLSAYGVAGISRDVIDERLADLAANVRLVSPSARIEWREIVG